MATDHSSAATASGLGHHLRVYATDFTALNSSGVDGHAVLLLDEAAQTLKVFITAEGMEPGQIHAQHIHGFPDDHESMPPTIAQDTDGDGFVELLEGLPKYGPIQLNLTTNPENAAHDHGPGGHDHTAEAMFPTADADGVLRYAETFRFDASDPNAQAIFDDIVPLEAKEIVLHGMTLRDGQGSGDGEADGTAGYKDVLPVAAGALHEVDVPAWLSAALQLGGQLDRAEDWLFGAA